MNKLLLIKYDSNYADEFDVDGFAVWPESQWEAHKESVKSFFDKRNAKRGPKPELPHHTDPKYMEAYRKVRDWERGEEVERYFGTNESMLYSSYEDYLRCFKVTEITPEEHAVLKKLFGEQWRKDIRFGMFLTLEDQLEDEDEDDDDSDE